MRLLIKKRKVERSTGHERGHVTESRGKSERLGTRLDWYELLRGAHPLFGSWNPCWNVPISVLANDCHGERKGRNSGTAVSDVWAAHINF